MWFLASEVVPVSRPQHSDLQGEDNRGNSSEVEDCLNELEIHDEDMYVNLKYTSHVFNYHSERHLYTHNTCTYNTCTHTIHVHTQHMYTHNTCTQYMYTQYMYTQHMYTQYMYTHNTCTQYMYTHNIHVHTTHVHTIHVHTQYMYTQYMYTQHKLTGMFIQLLLHVRDIPTEKDKPSHTYTHTHPHLTQRNNIVLVFVLSPPLSDVLGSLAVKAQLGVVLLKPGTRLLQHDGVTVPPGKGTFHNNYVGMGEKKSMSFSKHCGEVSQRSRRSKSVQTRSITSTDKRTLKTFEVLPNGKCLVEWRL